MRNIDRGPHSEHEQSCSQWLLSLIVKYFQPSFLIGYKTGVGWVFDFLDTHSGYGFCVSVNTYMFL